MATVEVTGLDAIVRDFDVAAEEAPKRVHQAVEVTARKIKDSARSRAKHIGPHAKYYPYSITYDIGDGEGGTTAVIGPDKALAQGALGNLLEFGSINNAPIPHLVPALAENAGDLERGILKATEEMLP